MTSVLPLSLFLATIVSFAAVLIFGLICGDSELDGSEAENNEPLFNTYEHNRRNQRAALPSAYDAARRLHGPSS